MSSHFGVLNVTFEDILLINSVVLYLRLKLHLLCGCLQWSSRSSHSQMFFKIGLRKNFTNFTGKDLCWSLFLITLQTLRPFYQKETPTQVVSCKICENFKIIFFYRTLPVAASGADSIQLPFIKIHPVCQRMSHV